MDILLTALASDISSRVISFLVAKYRKQNTMDKMIRLHRLLLRAFTIIEEVDGRYISNQGMLLQLRQLRIVMYKGHYVLDTFKGHAERCMFGWHMEKDHIIDFLMQPSIFSLEVLPIIGPQEIGKKTLVEHVLNEEMVKRKFSCIICLNSDGLRNLLGDGSPIEQNNLIYSNGKCLIVVELQHDNDLIAWRRFQSSLSMIKFVSKVILISSVQGVSRLGTTQALRLKKMRKDEFWYFFKTLSFGSTNPDEHKELIPIAMKIAVLINRDFIGAHVFSRLLRTNRNAQFWRRMLLFLNKVIECNLHVFGEHVSDIVGSNRPYYVLSNRDDAPHIWCTSSNTIPGHLVDWGSTIITMEGIMSESVALPTEGNFQVIRWQSPIAPYYSYISNCEIRKVSQVVSEEKCPKRNRRL
ncbi:hypothetical protein DAI22_01g220300 [Oryza sativa Japonica Group]|nr:hypothetical protein DAI22_01g220300 [Oryza sativa Japonica Group]